MCGCGHHQHQGHANHYHGRRDEEVRPESLSQDPVTVLKLRLAQGAITEEEYHRLLTVLGQ